MRIHSLRVVGAVAAVGAVLGVSGLWRGYGLSQSGLGHFEDVERVLRAAGNEYSAVMRIGTAAHHPANELSLAWGEGWAGPTYPLATSMQVRYRGQEIWVPRSVYSDLADVDSLAITESDGGCVIRLSGGDAGGAWHAAVLIRGEDVIQREVRSGEFPDEEYERTMYSTAVLDD